LLIQCCFAAPLFAASYTSTGSGNWSSAVWTPLPPSGFPIAGDSVTVSGGHTITIDAAQACASLTILGTVLFSGANGRLTSVGSIAVRYAGTLEIAVDSTHADRLPDTCTLSMQGGTFRWTSGTSNRSESIATLEFKTRHSYMTFVTTNGSQTLNCTNAKRLNYATVEIRRGASPFGIINVTNLSDNTGPVAPDNLVRWVYVVEASVYPLCGRYDASANLIQHPGNIYFCSQIPFQSMNYRGITIVIPPNIIYGASWSLSGFPTSNDHAVVSNNVFMGDTRPVVSYVWDSSWSNQGTTVTAYGNTYASALIGDSHAAQSLTSTPNYEFVMMVEANKQFQLSSIGHTFTGHNAYGFTKAGYGLLKNPSLSTHFLSAPINIVCGTVQSTTPGSLGDANGATNVFDGGTLDLYSVAISTLEPLNIAGAGVSGQEGVLACSDGISLFAGPITLTGDSTINVATNADLTLTGKINGLFQLRKIGNGTLGLAGKNVFTGPLAIDAGVLRTSGGSAIPDAVGVVLTDANGVLWLLNNSSETIGSISGGGSTGGNINLGMAALTCGADGSDSTFGGSITGTGGLTKTGAGTLTLTSSSASNNYSGVTVIAGGTLRINGTQTSSSIELNGGTLSGTGTTAGVQVNPSSTNSTIRPGTTSSGILNTGAVDLSTGTYPTILLRVGGYTTAGTDFDRLASSGALTLSNLPGKSRLVLDLNGLSTTGTSNGIITCAGVPSGTFETVQLINNPNGYACVLTYANGSVNATITAGGGTTFTLNTNNADWGVASNWTPNGVPGANDSVIIAVGNSSHSVALNGDRSVKNISFNSGGSITGANTLNVGGTITISGTASPTISCTELAFGTGLADINNASTGTLTISSRISGASGLAKSGSGMVVFSGNNTYVGFTAINAGTLRLAGGSALPDNTDVTLANVSGVTLDLNGTSETIGAIIGGGNIGGNITLASGALTSSSSASTTYAGVISGSGALTKSGSGTLTLSGANANAGETRINAGTLRVAGGSAISDNSVVVLADVFDAVFDLNDTNETVGAISGGGANGGNINLGSGTLTCGNSSNLTFDAVISGTGGLTKVGSGMLTLSRGNTYTGTTAINAGTLRTAGGNAISNVSPVVLANVSGGTLDLNNASEVVGSISGGGSTGGNIVLGSGTISCGGNGLSTAYAGTIRGTGGLTKLGTGVLLLSGINHYGGTTTITGGTLRLSGGKAISDGSAVTLGNQPGVIFDLDNTDECVLSISGGGTTGGMIALGSGNLSLSSGFGTFSGIITGTGGLTRSGGSAALLAGANTYTGTTLITSGSLRVSGGNAIADTGAVSLFNIASSDFDLTSTTERVGSIAGGGSAGGNVTLGAGKLICGGNNASTQFDGFISGNTGGQLEKVGTGILSLSSTNVSNNYTGLTTITNGVLAINGTQMASAILLNGGALHGTGTCGAISVDAASSNSTIQPGSALAKGTLTTGGATGNVDLSQGATPTVRIRISGQTGSIRSDRLACAGVLTLGGTSQLIIDLSGLTSDVVALPVVTCGSLAGSVSFNNIVFQNAGTSTVSAIWNGAFTSLDVSVTAAGLPGTTYTSTGSGNWDNTGTWTPVPPVGGPGSGDTAVILSNHQITLNGARNIFNVAFTDNGSIVGANSLTVGGAVTITGDGAPSIACATLAFGTATANVVNFSSRVLTISSQITGSGGLLKAGAGPVLISGNNTYTGNTTIAAGLLQISGGNAIDNSSAVVLANVGGAILNLNNITETVASINGGGAAGGNITLGSGTLVCGSDDNSVYDGIISGTGGLTKVGPGTLALSRANTYTGVTRISGGRLVVSAGSAISDVSRVLLDDTAGVIFELPSNSETVGSIEGGGVNGGTIRIGSSFTLTCGGDNSSTTFSGTITGLGAVTKIGYGTLTCTKIHNYLSPTIVSGGTLVTSGTYAGITLSGNATTIAGIGIVSSITSGVFTNCTIRPGSDSSLGVLNSGNVSISALTAATVRLRVRGYNTPSTDFDQLAISGTLTLSNATNASRLVLDLDTLNTIGTTIVPIISVSGAITSTFSGVDLINNPNNYKCTLTYTNNVGITATISVGGQMYVSAATGTSWNTPGHWNPPNDGTIPGASDSILISRTHTVTLDSVRSVRNVTFAGTGTLAGASTLYLGEALTGAAGISQSVSCPVNAAQRLNVTVPEAGTLAISGIIRGPNGLIKSGGGTLSLSGANAYAGPTLVNAGTLMLGTSNPIPNASSLDVAGNAVFNMNGASDEVAAISGSGNILLGIGTLTIGGNESSTFSGVISGTGAVTKIAASLSALTLSGNNTYTGATTISGGTLRLSGGLAISDVNAVTLANTSHVLLDLNGSSETVGSIAGGGTTGGNILLGSGTLTTGGNNTDTTFAGYIIGTGGLSKIGTGALTLSSTSGNNNYSDPTTVDAGTLLVNGTQVSSPVVLNGGLLGGTGTIAAVSVNPASTNSAIRPGIVATRGILRTNSVDLSAGTLPAIRIRVAAYGTAGTDYDRLAITGNLTLNNAVNKSVLILDLTGLSAAGTATGVITYSGTMTGSFHQVQLVNNTNNYNCTVDTSNAGRIDVTFAAGGTTYTSNSAATSWNTSTDWTPNGIPGAGDSIVVATGHTVTLDSSRAVKNVTFNGAGTITGAHTLSVSGTITTAGGATAISTTSLSAGGVLAINNSINTGVLTVSAVIYGQNGLTKGQTGTLVLSAANAYSATTTINDGTLRLSNGSNLPDGSALTIANAVTAILDLNGTSETIGPITGSASSRIYLNAGTLTTNATADSTFAGVISANGVAGAGNLVKMGQARLILSAANTYTGSTTINEGTLRVSGGAAISNSSAVIIANANGALLDVVTNSETVGSISGGGPSGGKISVASGITLTCGDATNTTFSGSIFGAGNLIKNGAGTLTLAGVNNYTGTTTVSAGTLQCAGGNAIPDSSAVLVNDIAGVFIDLNGSTETIGSLASIGGGAGGNITLGSGKLICGVNNTDTMLFGYISGNTGGQLEKVGTGTLTLQNSNALNNYTGQTTVSGGTVVINGMQTASAIVLNGGIVGGAGTCGAISVNPGGMNGIIRPNTAAARGTLTTGGAAGTVNLSQGNNPAVRIRVTGAAAVVGTDYDRLVCGGALTLGGGSKLTLDLVGLTQTGTFSATIITATSVSGMFSTIELMNNTGYTVSLQYLTTSIVVDFTAIAIRTITARETEDNDADGFIDRIKMTASAALNDDFDSVNVTVAGYTVSSYSTGTPGDNVFYVNLVELGSFDTNATPTVTVVANGDLVIATDAGIAATDKALPVLTATGWTDGGAAGVSAGDTLTLTFSESVSTVAMVPADIGLPVTNDTLSTTTIANQTNATISMTLAGTPLLSPTGTYLPSFTAVGFPSGIFIDVMTHITDANGNNPLAGSAATAVDLSGTLAALAYTSLNSGLWHDLSNWTPTPPFGGPDSGDSVIIASTHSITLNGDRSIGSVTFTDGGSIIGANMLNISGTISATGTGSPNVLCAALAFAGSTASISNSSTGTLTIISQISGTNGLTKAGMGLLVLTGTNTYTGTTTINAGTVQLAGGLPLPVNSAVVLADVSGAVLELNGIFGIVGAISGGGANGGNLSLGANTLTTVVSADVTYDGVIRGTGGFTKAGANILTLTRTNTYTGTTYVAGGRLRVAGGTAISDLSIVELPASSPAIFDLNGSNETVAAIAGGSSIVLGAGTLTCGNASDTTYSGIISGTGGLTKVSTGTLTLSGGSNNTSFTGNTTIIGGTLRVTGGSAIRDNSAVVLANAAGVSFSLNSSESVGSISGGGALGGNIVLGSSTLTCNQTVDQAFSGSISGNGGLTKAGVDMLTLDGVNTYTGTTRVNAGTLRVSGGNAIADVSPVVMNNAAGAVFDLNGTAEAVGSVSGGGPLGGDVTLGAGALTAGADNTATNFDGIISGVMGTVAKTGTGTLTLTRRSSYTGLTTINAGTLLVNASNTSSNVLVTGTGTLGGTGAVGTVTHNGGTIRPGTASGIGVLTASSTVLSGASTPVVTIRISGYTAGTTHDRLDLTTGGGTLNLSGAAGKLQLDLAGLTTIGTVVGAITYDGACMGTFNSVELINNSQGYAAFLQYNNGSLDIMLAFGITARETEDSDGDGHLDRIKMTAGTVNDDFTNVVVTVSGYGVTGYNTGIPGDNVFYVLLNQLSAFDTDATPIARVVSGGNLLLLTDAGVAATDRAKPVLLGAQLADLGFRGVTAEDLLTLSFSEPVTTTSMMAADIGLAVANDSLSTSTIADQTNTKLAITLAGSPILMPSGTYSPAALTAGSASGIYIARESRIADAAGNNPLARAIASAIDIEGILLADAPAFSSLSAGPNPGLTGQAIRYLAVASDVNNDVLSYTWNFGDGTLGTGSTTNHVYTVPGIYSVIVSVNDGSWTVREILSLVIISPLGIDFIDTDGDGVSDGQETIDGTDPLDPASVAKLQLRILKMRGTVKFTMTNKDICQISGFVDGLPVGFKTAGKQINLEIGGAKFLFIMDDKGRGNGARGSMQLRLKTVVNKATGMREYNGSPAAFTIRITNSNLQMHWADEGVDATADKTNIEMNFVVNVRFSSQLHGTTIRTTYSSKAGKGGKFKN
jgi:fibronectin-binding autotransporter adhesin